MNSQIQIIHLSIWYFVLGVLLIVVLLFLLKFVKKIINNSDENNKNPDWTVPAIDIYSGAMFYNWDPRIKAATLLIYCFFIASIQKIPLALVALLISILAVLLAKIPYKKAMIRIYAMAGFLGMFLIVMPLTIPIKVGDTIVVFGDLNFFYFNIRGVFVALPIVLKASSIALMMLPLFSTSPISVTIRGLSGMGVPNIICEMILLTHRYIYVFVQEAGRMSKSMKLRGFQKKTNLESLQILGNFLGMLFVKSFERTERVYEAMLSRGYNGIFPIYFEFNAKPIDWIKGIGWIIIGFSILIFDRTL
ncbi:MAG: cobalt ECF transporter T component CbiQ [Desulfobacterales bacterium]|nr:cobalt ECF transporter T component CbiQ [Desulfobacterales bacterium]